MKLRNKKRYSVFIRAIREIPSPSQKIHRIAKRVPAKVKTQKRTDNLCVKLNRINPGNVTAQQWVNYLKEVNRRDKEKGEQLQIELKRRTNMTDHVKPVDALVLDGNLAENWRRFKRNYNIFASAARVNGQTDDIKINTFLNAIGPSAVDLFDSFALTDVQREVYQTVVESFEAYCNPRKNVIYERYMFNQRNQRDGEKFDEFLMDLKLLSRFCEFGVAQDELIRDRIVAGVSDNRLRTRLLETRNLTLEMCIEKARTSEATQEQAAEMSKTATATKSVDAIRTQQQSYNRNRSHHQNSGNQSHSNSNDKRSTNSSSAHTSTNNNNNRGNDNSSNNGNRGPCKFCGKTHQPRNCPAYGKMCHKCKRKGHYKSMCNARSVACLSNVDSDDSDVFNLNGLEVFDVNPIHANSVSKSWIEKIRVEGKNIPFKIDTGAEIDVIPLHVIVKMNSKLNEKHVVRKTNIRLKPFVGDCINADGECFLNCSYDNKSVISRLAVVDRNVMPVLGLQTSRKLGIVPEPKENETL